MKKLALFIFLSAIVNLQNSFSNTLLFDFQKFINSENMINFYRSNSQETKLFVAQKSILSPFNNYNINEADLFMLVGPHLKKNVVFNRKYKIIGTPKFIAPLNYSFEYYNLGIYPVSEAISQTVKKCNLEREQLTTFAINLPASLYSSIMYIFTTVNVNGTCSQSLFDTFTKKISCKQMSSECYVEVIYN